MSLAVAFFPVLQSRADCVTNSFLVAEGDGVEISEDGSLLWNKNSSAPIRVTARSGWLVNGKESVTFNPSKKGQPGIKVMSRVGEGSEHVHCFTRLVCDDVHTNDIEIAVSADPAAMAAMYAAPATNVVVSVSASPRVVKQGRHWRKTKFLPCECKELPNPQEEEEFYYVVPDYYEWTSSAAGQTYSSKFWIGSLTKGPRQEISFDVTGKRQACSACECHAAKKATVDVYELSIMRPDYIGLDMTDAGKAKPIACDARAVIEPAPARAEYSWTSCGEKCEFIGETGGESVTYGPKSERKPSNKFLDEPLVVSATAWNSAGLSASATCTTNFTVVKVDVEIKGVGEDKEETEGALVQHVSDTNGLITVEGTNQMRKAVVKFSFEPKKDLPTNEVVTISCSGPGELYEELADGALLPVTTNQYPACEIASRKFFLHGHGASGSCRDGLIQIEHPASEAKDVAKYTVFGALLEIHLPKVIDQKESQVAEDVKLSIGSETFVNLDNDDNDGYFDGGGSVDAKVDGGDDELAKLVLKVFPKDLRRGTVDVEAVCGDGNVALWTTPEKEDGSGYGLGTGLSVADGFAEKDGCLAKTMWVEGVAAHTKPQGTVLRMKYAIEDAICDDKVAMTVVGVEQVKWKGRGNSINSGDELDSDPNWPAGMESDACRVFPGARAVGGNVESAPRDKVDVEVALTVAPPHALKLYLKSFDVDDPTAETGPIDNEANAEDNRGATPAKNGFFEGSAGGVHELAFPEGVRNTNCTFQVTMQPGDNFRIVANGDRDFLSQLENNDHGQDVGASEDERRVNKQRICSANVSGTPADREVRLASKYCSPVLTVWRFLHIETDSMAAPPETGPEKNFVEGAITAFRSNEVWLDVNLRSGFAPTDRSALPGRFEHGWIEIGVGTESPGRTVITDLTGNGDTYVWKDAGVEIPCELSKQGLPTIQGQVSEWSGSEFWLNADGGSQISTDYIGGTLNVAGVRSAVQSIASNEVDVADAPTIPFKLHDDDDDTILPGLPDHLFGNLRESDDPVANKYASLYIRPVYDGGGNIANNQNDVPFVRNTEDSSVYRWQSRANNSPRFWVVYLLAGFQDSCNGLRRDFDPDDEPGTWASANNADDATVGGVIFYMESMRDAALPTDKCARVAVHEVGHNFDLRDAYASPYRDGIMHGVIKQDTPSDSFFWRDVDVNVIRSAANPK